MINDYDIAQKVIVSSFDEEILEDVVGAAAPFRQFKVMSLRKLEGLPVPLERDGIVVLSEIIPMEQQVQTVLESRNQIVKNELDSRHQIGVYIHWHENEDEIWEEVFTYGDGVDLFYSDLPLEAMEARKILQANLKQQQHLPIRLLS